MIADENEVAIIGLLLAHPNESAPYVCAELRPEHFTGRNAIVYREILSLFSEGHSFDIPALAGRFREKGMLEKIGGFATLTDLAFKSSGVPSILPEHCRAVKDAYARRRLVALLAEKKAEADAPGCDVSALMSDILLRVEEIGHDRAKRKIPSMKNLVSQAITRMQQRHDKDESQVGVSTGLKTLDALTGGLRPGSQWVLAGPAKGGKSTLALTMLNSLAVEHGKRCAFFGLEMPSVENVERMICQIGRVSATGSRDGHFTEADFPKITQAAKKLTPAPIIFRDDVFDMAELAGAVRHLKSAYPDLYAVVLDYAQLLGADIAGDNREREVAIISRTCRKLSMQHGLCFIVLSQVNDDGKLRESRALGMDATTVVFIEFDKKPGVRKLRLVQRNGKSGIELRVAYVGEHFLFGDLAEDEQEEPEEAKPRFNGKKRNFHRD